MKLIFITSLIFTVASTNAQNIGIGTNIPEYRLTVKVDGVGIAQESSTLAHRIGFFTGAAGAYLQTHTNSPLRFSTFNGSTQMILTTNGDVGIGTSTPGARLQVEGSTYIRQNLSLEGTLNVGTSALVNNKGLVLSANSNTMKMRRHVIGALFNGLSPGATITTGFFFFGTDFTVATVTVGNCRTPEGQGGNWEKVFIVPFDIDVVNNRCRFKMTNIGNSAISFDATWDVTIIGE